MQLKIKRGGSNAVKSKAQGDMVSLCPQCQEFKIKSMMGPRLYVDEQGNVIPPKADAHMWRQCGRCGYILPIYNLKREGRLTSQLTPSTDPFRDKGQPKAISPKGRLGQKKKKDEWEFIEDADVRQELRQGAELISFSQS